jgi:hypothetical protein
MLFSFALSLSCSNFRRFRNEKEWMELPGIFCEWRRLIKKWVWMLFFLVFRRSRFKNDALVGPSIYINIILTTCLMSVYFKNVTFFAHLKIHTLSNLTYYLRLVLNFWSLRYLKIMGTKLTVLEFDSLSNFKALFLFLNLYRFMCISTETDWYERNNFKT